MASFRLNQPTPWAILIGIVAVGALAYLVVRAYQDRVASTPTATVKVVAAENFWGDITSQIGGSHVEVTSIITDPSADPHLYESDARDAAALSAAQLVVKNGLGYDDFINKLLGASPSQHRTVLSADEVVHAGSGENPHLWYDASRVKVVAAAITYKLAEIDPTHASQYRANLAKFDASLQPVLNTISTIKQKYPSAPVAFTERVPEYLLKNAGLDIKTPEGFSKAIEDGNDPSPADTRAMDTLVTSHQIKVLLYNSQATSPVTEHVKELAKQAGIPIVGVTETLPADQPHFQDWQLAEAKALLAALGG